MFPVILLASLFVPPLDEFGENGVERKPEVVILDGTLERAGLSGVYTNPIKGYTLVIDKAEGGVDYHTLHTVHEKQDEYMRYLVKIASKLPKGKPRVVIKGWHCYQGNRDFILVTSITYKPPPPEPEE
jgi:hypothetical protein